MTAGDAALAGGRLTIDLAALAENYRKLAALSASAETSAVVKADAYGLGIPHVVPALADAGCRTFFVALPAEGIAARKAAPDADVYVLSGPLGADVVETFRTYRLMPVLNSLHGIAIWRQACDASPIAAALHFDTGINRLGIPFDEAGAVAAELATGEIPLKLVMSHLACADDPDHPLNREQSESFQQVAADFEGIDSSLANSAGIMLGGDYLREMTRAGIALYGGRACNEGDNPMRPVVTAEARVLQVKTAKAGATVGYGATATLTRDTTLAIVSTGYSDGYHRATSGSGVPLRKAVPAGARGFIAGKRVPVVGRVSMDLTAFDVTACDGAVSPGDWLELFGPNMPLDDVAEAAGTIGYELLTSLGQRYHRSYIDGTDTS